MEKTRELEDAASKYSNIEQLFLSDINVSVNRAFKAGAIWQTNNPEKILNDFFNWVLTQSGNYSTKELIDKYVKELT